MKGGGALVVGFSLAGGARAAVDPASELTPQRARQLDRSQQFALQAAIERYEGTVIAVTHDRWFMRGMDRFLFFDDDGAVRELLESPYEEASVG